MSSAARLGWGRFVRSYSQLRTICRSNLLLIAATSTLLIAHVDVAYGQSEPANPSATTAVKPRLPPRVERFCRDVDNFPSSEHAADVQAKQFATRLRDALLATKPMPRVMPSDLSADAAKRLADYFHEDIVAAMAHKEVVAPSAILKTFLKSVRGEEIWKRIPLLTKHALIPKPLTDVPEVLVTDAQREKLTKAIAELTSNVKKIDELRQAYKTAYHGHRGWFKAIAPYFVEENEDDE